MLKTPTPEEVKRVHKLVDLINKNYSKLIAIAPDYANAFLIKGDFDRNKLGKLFYNSSMEKIVWEEDD